MDLKDMEIGEVYRVGNLYAKVDQGRRGAVKAVDRRIWLASGKDGPWVLVTMEAVAGVAALISANEEAIWPRPRYNGNLMWRAMLGIAVKDGLKAARRYKNGTYRTRREIQECEKCGTTVDASI